MCGRFTLTVEPEEVARHFRAVLRFPGGAPRYNIAPGQDLAVVVSGARGRELIPMNWGLIPPWTRDPEAGRRLINARAETVAQKPAFRDSFSRRPCLIPADGYYEWRKAAGRKTPFRITLPEEGLFALAGIWSPAGTTGFSCAILTTPAGDALREIHDRMPLILAGERDFAAWLAEPAGRRGLLRTYDGPLSAYPVSTAVNSSRVDGPELIAGI